MIDQLSISPPPAQAQTVTETKKVLRMVKNERMGGMVPKWETITVTHKVGVEENLTQAAQAKDSDESFETAMAYHTTPETREEEEPFGFGDLIDMINPLHHIPVVGHLYRSITGDEIRPIGKIIGGAVFGGPIGAGVSLANVVMEEETGKDFTGNAMALALKGDPPTFKYAAKSAPEKALAEATGSAQGSDLPASLLAFTDNGHSGFRIEKVPATSTGRTAGTMPQMLRPDIALELLMAREPITEVTIRKMPEKY